MPSWHSRVMCEWQGQKACVDAYVTTLAVEELLMFLTTSFELRVGLLIRFDIFLCTYL